MFRFFLFFLALYGSLSVAAQADYTAYEKLSYAEIDSIGYIHYRSGDNATALLYMQAGQAKARAEFGEQDSTFAVYTNNIGYFQDNLGNYKEAASFYLEALHIREKVLEEEHRQFTETLNNVATLYYKTGKYEEALPIYRRAKAIAERRLGPNHRVIGLYLNNLAALQKKLGNYDKALSLYLQSKDIREKVFGKEHYDYANSIHNIATLYTAMGKPEKALPLYEQALAIGEKALGPKDKRLASSLLHLSNLYLNIGAYDKALAAALQGKAIVKEVLGEEHPDFAHSLNRLSQVYTSTSRYEEALSLSIKAKAILQKVLGETHPYLIDASNSLANIYIQKGAYEKAWQEVQKAIRYATRQELELSLDQAWKDSLEQASYYSVKHIDALIASLKVTYLLLEKDTVAQAAQKKALVAELALALITKIRKQVSNEDDKLRLLAQSNDWLAKSLEVLEPSTQSHRAFELADQNKSVLLLQASQSEETYRLGALPDSLVERDKALLEKQSQLQAQLLQPQPDSVERQLIQQLNRVNEDIDLFLQAIQKNHPKYYQLKYQMASSRVEDMQALLDEKTALLEYVITDKMLHIFRVDKQGLSWHQSAIPDTLLRNNIQAFHRLLSSYQQIDQRQNYLQYSDLAHWFFQQLLAPALEEDDNLENLIIVTDGELGHLPFESFLVEPAPPKMNYKRLHYVLRDYNISYSYSAALWRENKSAPPPQNNGQLFAMAARYTQELDSSILQRRSYSKQSLRKVLRPLPAAREEVEALAQAYDGYFAFDSLATEARLRDTVADYAILHLAAHGILDEKRPILSSLALSEDGDSLHDNFWQAYEISKMELHSELVVLSACETGYGRFEQGNGIASLARAFMYAGVPSLVVSLWQVNDASTSTLMQLFYKNLSAGLDKSQALRQAKLNYIEQAKNPIMAHPSFWSPFILMGDPAPVELSETGMGNGIWYAAAAGVLLLLLIAVIVRRQRRGEA